MTTTPTDPLPKGEERRLPFAVRVLPLFALVFSAFVAWWWAMVLQFGSGRLLGGLVGAYSLPLAISLTAYAASRAKDRTGWGVGAPFIAFLLLLSGYATAIASMQDLPFRWVVATPRPDAGPLVAVAVGGPLSDPAALLGIAFVSAVVSVMLFPMGGLARYFSYRRPLFIAGVLFMPLFIALAAALRAPYHLVFPPPEDNVLKGLVLLALLAGFWVSGAWLASTRAQGGYAPGLTIRPMLPFRPDFLLPGGVLLVKGVVLTGVGLMLMIHDHLGLPQWNWWGFALAFWGIVLLIPVRGMWKMGRGRRPRMLGEPKAFGFKAGVGRELLLSAGLLILLYGFVSAFRGFVPFQGIGVVSRYNALPEAPGVLGVLLLASSVVLLVPARAWVKTRLVEGAETWAQLVGKQLLLYGGVVLLILGFIQTFNLSKDATMTGQSYLGFYPATNPFGLALGAILFSLGALLILVLRPLALRNELAATLRTMAGVVAETPEPIRSDFVARRLAVLCRMPDGQRDFHVRCMLEGVQALPDKEAMAMRQGMMAALVRRPQQEQAALMRSMDKVMLGPGDRALRRESTANGR